MIGQLDLFRQPPDDPPAPAPEPEPEPPRRTQMTELAGETWEDAFGNAA